MHVYLKIKVVSLAAEAALIRREERKLKRSKTPRATAARAGLSDHRRGLVRVEARNACLAYAFLRGRAYRQVEAKAFSLPDWSRVGKLVERYAEGDKREVMRRFSEWKDIPLGEMAVAA